MTNPVSALLRSKGALIALLVLAVAAVVAVGLLTMSDDEPEAGNTVAPTPSASVAPSATPTTPSPSPSATPSVEIPESTLRCIGPDEQFNVEGADVDTLRPDCGDAVAPIGQRVPLGLGCGGTYPTIMYKTRTDSAKATVCGTNSSGEDLRMVAKLDGESALDLKAEYEPSRDAFVAEKNGATYVIEAYNGSLTIERSGATDRQESRDWISLDNESDYD